MGRICENIERNIDYINNPKNNWIKNRIKFIRYEDLALNKVDVTNDIYKFVGLQNSKGYREVKNWINLTENSNQPQQQQSQTDLQFGTTKSKDQVNQIISKWLKTLSYPLIKLVEENCEKTFETFGYNKIDKFEYDNFR